MFTRKQGTTRHVSPAAQFRDDGLLTNHLPVERVAGGDDLRAAAALEGVAWPGSSNAVRPSALEAVGSSSRGSGWAPSGRASLSECRTGQSHQAHPEEA